MVDESLTRELSLAEAVEQCRTRRKRDYRRELKQKRRELRQQWTAELLRKQILAEQVGVMPLSSRALVAFDLENAGFAPEDIVEIAALRIDLHTGQAHRFEQLISPRAHLNAHATAITGIKSTDLRGKPRLREVLPRFLQFVGHSPVVGHGILASDLMHLNYARRRYRLGTRTFAPRFIDTQLVAQRMYALNGGEPADMKFNLPALLALYGIELPTHHRALADALGAYLLLRALLDDCGLDHRLPLIGLEG